VVAMDCHENGNRSAFYYALRRVGRRSRFFKGGRAPRPAHALMGPAPLDPKVVVHDCRSRGPGMAGSRVTPPGATPTAECGSDEPPTPHGYLSLVPGGSFGQQFTLPAKAGRQCRTKDSILLRPLDNTPSVEGYQYRARLATTAAFLWRRATLVAWLLALGACGGGSDTTAPGNNGITPPPPPPPPPANVTIVSATEGNGAGFGVERITLHLHNDGSAGAYTVQAWGLALNVINGDPVLFGQTEAIEVAASYD
jgi:hypothetical protein